MPNSNDRAIPNQTTHYAMLGLHPSASAIEIRRAYRQLSKRYHPDSTDLPCAIATAKFQQLNEAYATLSNPERRMQYDLKIGYSRLYVVQAPPDYNRQLNNQVRSSSAYIDPTERPLSAGEIFVLFLLGLTFVGCILLAIAVGLTRGDTTISNQAIHPPTRVWTKSVGGDDLGDLGELKFVPTAYDHTPPTLQKQITSIAPKINLKSKI